MISFEEAGEMLDEIAEELPDDFYRELNGGICLLPDVKIHPESRNNNDLFILGEYHRAHDMGRYISIYYGSFLKVYGRESRETQKNELRRILRHEFTHHVESLAGIRDLEKKDAVNLAKYKRNIKQND